MREKQKLRAAKDEATGMKEKLVEHKKKHSELRQRYKVLKSKNSKKI